MSPVIACCPGPPCSVGDRLVELVVTGHWLLDVLWDSAVGRVRPFLPQPRRLQVCVKLGVCGVMVPRGLEGWRRLTGVRLTRDNMEMHQSVRP